MNIKQKLLAAFLLILLILISFGIYVFVTVNTFDEISDHKAEKYEELIDIEKLNQLNTAIALTAMDIIVDKDEGKVGVPRQKELKKLFHEVSIEKVKLFKHASMQEEKIILEDIFTAFNKLEPIVTKDLINLVGQGGSSEEFSALDDAIDGAAGSLEDNIVKIISIIKKDLKHASHEEEVYASNMKRNIILFIVFATILSLVIALLIIKGIMSSITEFQKGLLDFFKFLNKEINDVTLLKESKDEIGKMAKLVNVNISDAKKSIEEDRRFIDETIDVLSEFEKGDLSQRISISVNNDALMQLKKVLDSMATNIEKNIDNVLEILEQYSNYNYLNKVSKSNVKEHLLKLSNGVNSLGESITTMLVDNKKNGIILEDSSNVLLKNVDILNKNTNDTAASLEETSAALEEITSTIVNTTDNIVEMSSFANKVTDSIKEGNDLAKQTTLAMDEINEQVSSINDAITVIDQIAFQTNILSLNAAVEAATAGEAGKGFAVVAQEVRNLASRSAEAAKEIKDLVESASVKANEGKRISDEMIGGYGLLNENIDKTITLIKNVETSSQEQRTGIEQINDAVTKQDQQTQNLANIASQTQEIANKTLSISSKIVQNANEKEFEGKNDIKSENPLEKKEETLTQKVEVSLPKKKNIISKKEEKISDNQIFSSNTEDDQWESF